MDCSNGIEITWNSGKIWSGEENRVFRKNRVARNEG